MAEDLLEMRRNPVGNWTIRDVERLCRQHGILCEAPRGGGSHYKVAHPMMPEKLTIPYKRPIKPVYIRKLAACRGGEDAGMTQRTYPVVIEPLPADEGGGFLALVPDLPGCMSDGASPEEAVANVQDAIATWIEAAYDLGHDIPTPSRHLALEAGQ